MKKLVQISTFLLFLTAACMPNVNGPGMPGHISSSVSKFDSTKQLKMEPAWLYDSAPGIKVSLFKNTKMKENDFVMTVVVAGAETFADSKSLHFNVDDDIYSFESLDSLTDIETTEGFYNSVAYFPPTNWSSKDYLVNKEFINLILNARSVVVIDSANKPLNLLNSVLLFVHEYYRCTQTQSASSVRTS
jgi:hypothetical protein